VRENDLVIGTFGRGIYILDDYSPLRTNAASLTGKDAHLFEVKDPWQYVEGDKWDGREKGSMGAAFFTAPNPEFGAIFTYHMNEKLQTRAEARRSTEREAEEKGEDVAYPSWDELRVEDHEESPSVVLIIKDSNGQAIRNIAGNTDEGLHRTAWDLRWPATDPVVLEHPEFRPYWESEPQGPLVTPGEYSVTLAKRVEGKLIELAGPQSFTVKSLDQGPETSSDPAAVEAFKRKAGELDRKVQGAVAHVGELENRIAFLTAGISDTPRATEDDAQAVRAISARLATISTALTGDRTIGSRAEPVPWSVSQRASIVYQWLLSTRSPVPGLYKESYEIAAREFADVLTDLKAVDRDLDALETRLESLGAPWTPGRTPGR
jgi:hypothetical protein